MAQTFDFDIGSVVGNGISSASFDTQTNALTLTFTNGTTFTTPSLKGAPGDNGESPVVTVTTITGGHRVTITDEDHPSGQSFDVMDGADGDDGYSPTVTVTEITGGHRVTITDKTGAHTFDVMDGQGGGGTTDYTELSNKPKINNVELDGNKTAHDLGLAAQSDIPTVPVKSVNSKTGAVNLTSGDIAYDKSATYQAGSVGAELQDLDTNKQDAPSTAGTAGQILALALIDDKIVPVWITPASGGDVTDVQIDGTSIVDAQNVANIPAASSSGLGVAKIAPNYGISINANKELVINLAGTSEIKNGTAAYRPVTASHAHESAFYGLAKAAGDATQSASANAVGTYTDEAKTAIKSMLGVGTNIINLSGTQVTQVGVDNTFYICGELTELNFTAPQTGITAIRFTSGTTPTVATLTGVTMPDDWGGVEANKVYEINILNGFGVWQSWGVSSP